MCNYVHARVSALSQTHKLPMTRSEFVGWDESENNGYAIGLDYNNAGPVSLNLKLLCYSMHDDIIGLSPFLYFYVMYFVTFIIPT